LVTASLVVVAGALVALAAVPAPAAATNGPCLADYPTGPTCTVWKGKVRYVDDGDTLDADVPGDGLGGLLRIRIIGIQAMEQTVYRAAQRAGDCHAVDATKRLEQLVKRSKKRIRVTALFPQSRSRGRRLRSIAVRYKGRWRDVGRILVSEGQALWWPGGDEDASNVRYSVLSQRAAAAHRGLFSPSYCGIGPNEGQPIKLWVNWDADGSDNEDVNGEWVKVKNLDPVNPLPLDRWYVRDSSLRRFTFPPGATVAPGGEVTLYVGQGEHFDTEYFWGLTRPAFENPSHDDHGMGDGAYLFDPQGDVRASMIYPCRVNCADPYQGAIELVAQPRGDEYVSIKNNSGAAIDLEGYQLKSRPFGYSFPPGSVLAPGETMRIDTEGDPADDTPLEKHWGMTGKILYNGGGTASLGSYTDVTLACTAWGSKSC
ncbi:MAG: competence protein ComEC, partial [Pseudonocardiales bacterium]|nr:competence protein ComEC [Pseudonocardiales bacterium]